MNDFNKIISLFIGLFVVIFVIAFVLGRFKTGSKTSSPRLGGALGGIFNSATATPSPRPTSIVTRPITIKRTVESQTYPKGGTTTLYNTNGTVKTIPKTGPEFLLPLIGSSLLAGVYLRKRS